MPSREYLRFTQLADAFELLVMRLSGVPRIARAQPKPASSNHFIFKRHDTIGANAAEDDGKYLTTCFVDTGDLDVLCEVTQPRSIVLGRTGSGKTALLNRLQDREARVIRIDPESLALEYVSNSTILNFVSELGVNLDVFFRMLWRHVFAIEISKHRFKLDANEDRASSWERFLGFFRSKPHSGALKYLEHWGRKFWEEEDHNITEQTVKIEQQLSGTIGASVDLAKLGVEGARKITEEQKTEIVSRTQKVINELQIRELKKVIETLDSVLDDPQKRYFVVIDRLDINWTDDKFRYPLIRALIETVTDFRVVKNAKIILALRHDLMDRVIRLSHSAGFQAEKFVSLCLPMRWSREQLTEVLNLRIQKLVEGRYTKRKITHKELFGKSLDGQAPIDYLLDRTLMRPRDVIAFVNYCIEKAESSERISGQMLKDAEMVYSKDRLRSLADEWRDDLPNLLVFINILRSRKSFFAIEDVTSQEVENFLLEYTYRNFAKPDVFSVAAARRCDGAIDSFEFLRTVFAEFYHIGLVGVKLETFESISWSYAGESIDCVVIRPETKIHIHKLAWRALDVTDKET
jgi:hypothetical protein